MSVSVVKTQMGDYRVTLNGETITLPAGSRMTEDRRTASARYGTPTKYIELVQGGEVAVMDAGVRRILAEDEEGLDISEQLAVAWSDPEEEETMSMAAPMPLPKPSEPPKKDGVLSRALKAAKDKLSRQTKEAKDEAKKQAKEVEKKADDVASAIKKVEKELHDLEKVCATTGLKGGSRLKRKTRRSKGKRRHTKRREF